MDSSTLIKLYVKERESEALASYVEGLSAAIPFSHLHEIELKNGLSLKLFRKETMRSAVQATVQLIYRDLASGVLQRTGLSWPDVFRTAGELAERYSPALGCRSLDLLHVASALLLQATDFLTYDERQATLVSKVGLKLVRI